MLKNLKKIIFTLIFTLVMILYFISLYINSKFDNIPFDQLLYTLRYSKGTNKDVLFDGIIYVIPRVLITLTIIFVIQFIIKKYVINNKKDIYLKIRIINFNIKYKLFNFSIIKRIFAYLFLCLMFLFLTYKYFRIDDYLFSITQTTDIYENYYVDPHNVNVTFNNGKRNLIYIYLESFEVAGASIKNGGAQEKSYIPKLEELALNNINFSNTEKLGGATQIAGTTYTAASLVGQTSGTPVSIFVNANNYHGFSDSYPGLYSIGEVLEKNGYKNYFLLGSDADFGGRSDYFSKHGNYKIMDYKYALENNWIPKDYNVWWGFEDKKLFEFAKKELLEISKKDEPFNFTMLTADTHFIDGYYDETCGDKEFGEQYANVFYCNDNMIYNFIKWIMEQDFYKDTTIILTGDHYTMQGGFYDNLSSDYKRTIYNTIINSSVTTENTKNRQFSVIDMYPTTLASLGAEIEGNQLGFGVNLFSDKRTLIEEYGEEYIGTEFSKRSVYYNDYILGQTYYEVNRRN